LTFQCTGRVILAFSPANVGSADRHEEGNAFVSEPARITLLSRNDCGFCDDAKQVLARVGAQYPLQVVEVSLDSREGQAIATSAGVLFAPGVLVDGQPFSFGRLSERKLRRTLEKRALQREGC
jgi:glutaredoxin